ncbi:MULTISPECIES: anti-sigma factor family protein [unclassified Streptomyces]|uniref:anti-sigma factor family protein n=1 Tax=unclassified Streptomyces TaxID=2593676 RepID=UPI003D8AD131
MPTQVPDCAVIRELLPLYVLDALEPGEAAPVPAHLGTCPVCRAEHDELAEVVAHLAVLREALIGEDGTHLDPRSSAARHGPCLPPGKGLTGQGRLRRTGGPRFPDRRPH